MTKKKPAKRIASNGPRLPGQPTKKTVKARARARKQDVTEALPQLVAVSRLLSEHPEVTAQDVHEAIDLTSKAELQAYLEANMRELINLAPKCPYPVDPSDDVGLVGQQAVEYKPGDSFEIIGPDGPGHAQPVDVPIQVTPAFDVSAVTRRELRLNPPNLSPKQQRAKRRLEDGTGWRCLNCYRVLSPKLSGCPFCNTRKTRP